MTESTDPEPVDPTPEAFADGELDLDETLSVLERMAQDPQVTRAVIHQLQLRRAISRTMLEGGQAPPAELRTKILGLAGPPSAAAHEAMPHRPPASSAPGRSSPGRWAALAIAAMLLVSVLVFQRIGDHAPSPVSEARYATFVHRHLGCSRKISELRRKEQFVQDVELLPGDLAGFLGGPLNTALDLSAIGYAFFAVGECSVPGDRSVHLIYRAKNDPSGRDTISLWIRRDDGMLGLQPNRPYVHTGDGMDNPLLLWQNQEMIFYLVGHSLGSIENAARTLRVAS